MKKFFLLLPFASAGILLTDVENYEEWVRQFLVHQGYDGTQKLDYIELQKEIDKNIY